MGNNKIIKRSYYEVGVELLSPFNISNGNDFLTDADVLKNSAGECFIPGTSLAGAFRNHLAKEDLQNDDPEKMSRNGSKKRPGIFGYSDGEDGSMSSVFVSDLYFDEGTPTTSVRDRVSLGSDKGVDNKFDIEIIERGATGTIRIEAIQREQDPDPDTDIEDIILALADGDIRIGAIKNRGFGRIKVLSVRKSEFKERDLENWLKFLDGEERTKGKVIDYEEWSKEKSRNDENIRYEKIEVPLRLTGGISIRRYSAQPGKADFEHITSNSEPVIPGTSWNGAIRADARRILIDFGLDDREADLLIEEWFGKVKADNKEDDDESWQSRIVISESIIEGAKALPMTRNNINRFTAGTKDGALYTEISYIGGKTTLTYMIRKDDDDDELHCIKGMMKLVVRDICEGMVAIGGQVAVGRGIFSGNTNAFDTNDGSLRALYNKIVEIKERMKIC